MSSCMQLINSNYYLKWGFRAWVVSKCAKREDEEMEGKIVFKLCLGGKNNGGLRAIGRADLGGVGSDTFSLDSPLAMHPSKVPLVAILHSPQA